MATRLRQLDGTGVEQGPGDHAGVGYIETRLPPAPTLAPGVITLDLPPPPSVNRTRRINWDAMPAVYAWTSAANKLGLAHRVMRQLPILGQFEARLVINEKMGAEDLDNLPKIVIDYARRLGFVRNDSRRYLRRVIIEFGEAPEGCRLILTPINPSGAQPTPST
jgi:Holliday junction resolvase RusA-like endonuclease